MFYQNRGAHGRSVCCRVHWAAAFGYASGMRQRTGKKPARKKQEQSKQWNIDAEKVTLSSAAPHSSLDPSSSAEPSRRGRGRRRRRRAFGRRACVVRPQGNWWCAAGSDEE